MEPIHGGRWAAGAHRWQPRQGAGEEVGGEAGERIVKLYDKVKAKLTGGGAEALADFEKQPGGYRQPGGTAGPAEEGAGGGPGVSGGAGDAGRGDQGKGRRSDHPETPTSPAISNVTTQIAGSGNVVR